MRKEVIIAVALGGALGLVIAFGIWRANLALTPSKATTETSSVSADIASPSPTLGTLIVNAPEDESLVNTASVTVSGRAEPNSTVVITSPTDEASVLADNQGNFSSSIKLDSGANAILVTAVNDRDEEQSQQLTVTYSTQAQ